MHGTWSRTSIHSSHFTDRPPEAQREGGHLSQATKPRLLHNPVPVPAVAPIPLLSAEGARGQESIKCSANAFLKKKTVKGFKSLRPPSAPRGPQAKTLSSPRRPLGGGNLSTSSRYPAGPQARSGSLHDKLRLRQEADRVGGEMGWRVRSTTTTRELGRRGQGHLRFRDRSQLPAPSPLFHRPEPKSLGPV